MSIKGFRKILFGEKMPDKDDPKYREKYERDVSAGRKFARVTRLDKVAAKTQRFADRHKILFLAIVFGIVIASFTFNVCRMVRIYHRGHAVRSAVEMQDSLLRVRHWEIESKIVEPHQQEEQ